MKHVWNYLIYFGFSTLFACVLYIWFPEFNAALLSEDRGIENLTVSFYLLAALLALYSFRKAEARRSLFIVLAVLGVLGALEELSYGERILSFAAPEISGVSIDTLHDFFYLAANLWSEHRAESNVYVWVGLCLLLAALFMLLFGRLKTRRWWPFFIRTPPFMLLLIIVVLGLASLTLDLTHQHGLPFMLEELFEMNAAAALVFCSLSMRGATPAVGRTDTSHFRTPSSRQRYKTAILVILPYTLVAASLAYYTNLDTAEKVRLSTKGGNLYAYYEFARMFDEGDGVPVDKKESMKWALKGAEGGNANAQLLAAMHYYHGRGIEKDLNEAARWCLEAAKRDHEWAQLHLGVMYYTGTGVAQDYAEAASWLRKAADHDLRRAETMLGYMYYMGEGVTENRIEAAKWYRKAAEHDHAKAQFHLGMLYIAGSGVARDEAEGIKWLERAAQHGSKEALAFMSSKKRLRETRE